MTIEEVFKLAISTLECSKLKFAIAGGFAASVYRDEERFTKDIDFVVNGDVDLLLVAEKIIGELGLSPSILRKADLDGGPLFAIKKRNTPEMIVLGRDREKIIPGVDFLLPSILWVPLAVERAQSNIIDWGFAEIPTMTIEDVIIAKLISSARSEREQDIIDLRSIFRSGNHFDYTYVVARMKEFKAVVPQILEADAPIELNMASKRIIRESRRKHQK